MCVVDAVDVDLHDLGELLGGLLEKGLFPPEDAGAADEDVEPAEALDGGIDRGTDSGFVGHVGFEVDGVLSKGLDIGSGFRSFLGKDVGDCDVASLFGDAESGRAADASGAAGNQSDASFLGGLRSGGWA